MPVPAAVAASCGAGWIVPTSLFATRAVATAGAASASCQASSSMRPAGSMGTNRIAADSCAWSQATVSVVAWCSPSGTMSAASGPAARHRPVIPRFTDSVPPEVSTTSMGSQSRVCASRSRDSSSTRRAACPAWWIDDGLPMVSEAVSHASRASGRSGAEAA